MKLGARIKQLRQEKGLTQSQFGSCFNLAESTISLYEAGKRSPDYEILRRFALFFNVSIDYLLGHTNDRYPASLRDNSEEFLSEEKSHLNLRPVKLPVYSEVGFGPGGITYAENSGEEWAALDGGDTANYYWYRVKDDSMSGDGILPLDLVLIREQPQVEYGEIGLVVVNRHLTGIYRIFKKESSIVLHSSNAVYPPRFFTGKNLSGLRVVGKVIEVKRKL